MQAQNIHIDTVKGDVVKGNKTINNYRVTKVYNIFNEENKDNILITKNWLDTTKPFAIVLGTTTFEDITYQELKTGKHFLYSKILYTCQTQLHISDLGLTKTTCLYQMIL